VSGVTPLHVIEATKVGRGTEVQADFLGGFPFGSVAGAAVSGFNHATRKCHLAGPGVTFALCTLDEQHLELPTEFSQHHGHRCPASVARFQALGLMIREPCSDKVYVHLLQFE
jgi:hypothetical protein